MLLKGLQKTTLLDYDGAFRLKNTDADHVGFHVPTIDITPINTPESISSESDVKFTEITKIPTKSESMQTSDSVHQIVSDEVKDEISCGMVSAHETSAQPHDEPIQKIPQYRMIGVCFNTYILVEQEGKLLIIDKHAAHERIIFEQLKNNLMLIEHASQMLLIPIEIKLSAEEYSSALEYSKEIRETGFEFSLDSTDMSARIESIPDMLDIAQAQDVFLTSLDNLSNNRASATLTRDAVYERALYQSACKAAVKGGRQDNDENIKWICDTLMSIPDIKVCPHGRPVVTELDKRYIDRQFERIK